MIAHRLCMRIAVVLLAAVSLAQCGDGSGSDNEGTDVGTPPRGTFVGTLSDGEPIRIEVDSIREVAFTCDGTAIQEIFAPPRPIDADGDFSVEFTDGGRRFDVRGHFSGADAVGGSIVDQRHECDATFNAVRVRPLTPTASPPTPTPTPSIDIFSGTVTATPTVSFTPRNFTPPMPICTCT